MNFLITGASGAIGGALAGMLAAQGHTLALAGRDAAKLQALAQSLPGTHLVLAGDLTHATTAEPLMAQALAGLGRIDGLAHCAGATLVKPLHLISAQAWQEQFDVNVSTAFHVCKAAVAQSIKDKTPLAIVLVSSVVAHAGFANHEAVAAAKSAVAAFGLSIAATYADRGIRVNIVAPGLTRSPLTQRFIATPDSEKRSAALIPTGRIGEPQEVAAMIAFFLSAASNHITGQIIGVDGGQGALHVPPKVIAKPA
jgi:NAD(P)-dependent dehydrogenase (short-subunit alcohol dehydrogenase family)